MTGIYTCTARVFRVGAIYNITEASQHHLQQKTDVHVTGLDASNQPLKKIPHNIEDFFPNIESLDFRTSQIETVEPEIFDGLKKLKQVHIAYNMIEAIPADIFINNPLLIGFAVHDNPLKHVAHNVFDSLLQLDGLYVSGLNSCLNDNVDGDRSKIINLIFRILVHCPPTYSMMESKLIKGAMLQKSVDKQIADRLNPLVLTQFEMGEKIKDLEQRLQKFQA